MLYTDEHHQYKKTLNNSKFGDYINLIYSIEVANGYVISVLQMTTCIRMLLSQSSHFRFHDLTRITRRVPLMEQELFYPRNIWVHPCVLVGFVLLNRSILLTILFVFLPLIFSSSDHCIVCPCPTYSFWLSHRWFQTFLGGHLNFILDGYHIIFLANLGFVIFQEK